jgi:hypothetical protein
MNKLGCFRLLGKRFCVLIVLLVFMGGLASAIQTAEIVSRNTVQLGIIGGYQSDADYIGGLGGIYEMEFPLSKSFSISADVGAGYSMSDGPLAGGGPDLKYRFLKLKHVDLSAIGYGRVYYQFAPQDSSYYLYGGGALLVATTKIGSFTLTAGGGASYDIYGNTDDQSNGQLGPVGMVSLSFLLSKTSDLGLAFEYGGDRFFLGAYLDFAIRQPTASAGASASKKASPTTPKK